MITISGVSWGAVASAIAAAGRDARRQISMDMPQITRPISESMKQKVMSSNGGRGGSTGLRSRVAGSVRVTSTGGGGRIQSSGVEGRLNVHMDNGAWSHPVYGGPGYASQSTTAQGWFTDTARERAPEAVRVAQRSVETSIRRTAARVDAAG